MNDGWILLLPYDNEEVGAHRAMPGGGLDPGETPRSGGTEPRPGRNRPAEHGVRTGHTRPHRTHHPHHTHPTHQESHDPLR